MHFNRNVYLKCIIASKMYDTFCLQNVFDQNVFLSLKTFQEFMGKRFQNELRDRLGDINAD